MSKFKKIDDGLYINTFPPKKNINIGLIKKAKETNPDFYVTRYMIIQKTFENIIPSLISKIKKNNLSKTIFALDVGCGEGFMFKAYKEVEKHNDIKFRLFGLDTDPICLKNIKTKVNLRVGNALKMPYRSNCFDIITCSQVIEHLVLSDIVNALIEIRRVLKPEGVFYIETPNPESLLAKTMGNNWWMYIEKSHQTLMSPQCLKIFHKNAGFSKIISGSRLETDTQIDEIKEIYSRSNKVILKIIKDYLKPLRHRLLRYYLTLTKKGSITTIIAFK